SAACVCVKLARAMQSISRRSGPCCRIPHANLGCWLARCSRSCRNSPRASGIDALAWRSGGCMLASCLSQGTWPRRWKLAAGVLLSFALLLPSVLAGDATPDSATHPPEPHPALQRIKHLARLGVDRWHSARHRGYGVKIAVLDSGFRGFRHHLGKALP